MEVSSQLHVLATLFPVKGHVISIGYEAGWATARPDVVARRKILAPFWRRTVRFMAS